MIPWLSPLGNNKFDYSCQNSRGKLGGLITIWDPDLFNKVSHLEGEGFFIVYGSWVFFPLLFGLVNVYAPQNLALKKALWQHLQSIIMSRPDIVWIVFGDFNEVREADERKGCQFNCSGAAAFNGFIAASDLTEIRTGVQKYTRISSDGLKVLQLVVIGGEFRTSY